MLVKGRFSLVCVFLSVLSLSMFPPGFAAAPEFKVISVEGEVLHVVDGKDPVGLKAGDALPAESGRIVTMEDGIVKLAFPNGKEFQLMQNAMMFLSAKAQTLEDACAAVGSVRERTVVFLKPSNGSTLPSGKPLQVILGIDLSSSHFKNVSKCSLKIRESGESGSGKVLAQFSIPEEKKIRTGDLQYRTYKLEIKVAPTKAGDFDLFVETVETPLGKALKPECAVSFEKGR
ncbi:hypothetical protein HYY75_02595 [bacterium]|nr:hypothetical protein [bacterium]